MTNYTLIEKPEMILVGIECRTSNNPEAGPKDIPLLWQKFYQDNIVSKIPNKSSTEIIALYCDYETDATGEYTVIIGCPVTSVEKLSKKLVSKIIPASKYAHFSAIGEFPESLISTWNQIWQTKLPRTYTGDFEVYGEKAPNEVDLFIAVQ
ncbi:GyrI-like domain-containing protein [Criblamydia sequanensis]|uniref:Transcriptional regulator n=1 Tax=Candidatus Criblamydia sequanensis CRIB-18 TaxID=1437425 RepID=A0A090D0R5_9BACT|nr:GyrI-like domain-containing protein [Criblamydia sequanensis]CDR34926.1 Transcriptional regulator [Criblamydia sequanensis CRIB-18]